MAVRTDVVVDFTVSPRIITVLAPSVEITLQDLHDTLREIEDDVWNLKEPKLVNSSGKEALGGGVEVGITSELQDAQLSFEARVDELEEGTVTSTDALGVTLIDSGASFDVAQIARGDLVYNSTDGSAATVVSVTDGQELITNGLSGGIDDEFFSGDSYVIYDVIRCNISGGNLVAVDDVDVELDPVFPTFGTQIVRASSSSATLQELENLQFASFNGGVTVDLTSSFSGTVFPIGTFESPVNNFTDALTIASTRGFKAIFIIGDATIDSGLTYDGFIFRGESVSNSTLTITASASVVGCVFERATLTGTLDGSSNATECSIATLTFVSGILIDCLLIGPITLSGAGTAHLLNCWSGVTGANTPIIDMGGGGKALALRNYNGGIELRNHAVPEDISIDLNSGHIILDSTITDGTFIIRGIGKLTDNSTGSAVVDDLDLIQGKDIRLIRQMLSGNATITGTDPFTVTVFDEDGVTVLKTFTIPASGLTRTTV